MLGYCQLDPWEQTSVKFHSKYKTFHSRKCFRKHRLRNGGHFVQEGWVQCINRNETQIQTLKLVSAADRTLTRRVILIIHDNVNGLESVPYRHDKHYFIGIRQQHFNALRPRQNGCYFADDIFEWIFLNKNVCISIKISLKFLSKGPINHIPSLVQIMAWRRPGDKPLSEPMIVGSLGLNGITHKRNGHHFAYDALNCIFLIENCCILFEICY